MSLFGKKKEELKQPTCCCEGNSGNEPAEGKSVSECCGKTVEGICCIKVLGAGCKSCHQLYENVKKAVSNLGINVEVEYITDMEKVMSYGAMSMPALVVNERVVSVGKVLKESEVMKLIDDR